MSDYTPSTEEARAACARDAMRSAMHNDSLAAQRGAKEAFDRWLAAHDAEKRAEWEAEQGEVEWVEDFIQYGHLLDIGVFIVEPRGKNYSTHQRRVKTGRPESSWVPVEQEDAV